MKNTLLWLVMALLSANGNAQNTHEIIIGKQDSVYSRIIGEQRQLWIYTPDMSQSYHTPHQQFPVLYLLDGDSHFQSVAGLVQQLSQANGNTVLPEMIIVGILNTDRTRDLTPTHILQDLPLMDSNASKTTGGGQNFIAFMEKELMPYIDAHYPTAPYKVLIGHSFGGLTVMNLLTKHPSLFNGYIAIDPSMWYNKENFLAATKKKLSAITFNNTRLYLGIANTLPEGMVFQRMKNDRSADTRHIRSIFELDAFLKHHPNNGLKYSSRYYPQDSHVSVPLIAEYDGLRSIFSYYRINITAKDFTDTTDAIARKYSVHYKLLSKEMGFTMAPPESFIKYLAQDALNNKHFSRAASLYKLNIENYPQHSEGYSAYGDLLALQKDTLNAIAFFKKALLLQENDLNKNRLAALEGRQLFVRTEQELQQYAAVFDLLEFKTTVTILVKQGALWAIVPGEKDTELVPLKKDVFTVKDKTGFTISFEMEAGKPKGFTSVQPNGIFTALLKK